MTTGGGAVGGEIFVNIRTEGGANIPGTGGGTPRPAGGGAPPKDPGMSLLNDKQKEQLEKMRDEKKSLKEYQDFQKLKNKENQNELLNELQRARRQATVVAGAVTTGMLARNSKIMATTSSALTQIFGAFVDVFLMPFIPLIIPVLSSLAKLLPRFKEWWEKLVSEEGWSGALKKAAGLMGDMIKEWGVKVGAMLGFSKAEVEKFYANVGKLATSIWKGIQDAWTASVDYIKGVWEESGGNLWKAIKIVADDFWINVVVPLATTAWDAIKKAGVEIWETHIVPAAQATWSKIQSLAATAWCAFASWQPGVASRIQSAWESGSANVKEAWTSASGYVKDVWEESGGNLWEAVKIMAGDAWGKITGWASAAWCSFVSWQPGVASTIKNAWGNASTYVQDTWQLSGGNFGTFMLKVADDAGQAIVKGMRWLWGDGGGGLKAKMEMMFVSLGNWLESKGMGRMGLPTAAVRTGAEGESDITLGGLAGGNKKVTLAGDLAQVFGNPKSWMSPGGLSQNFARSETARGAISGAGSWLSSIPRMVQGSTRGEGFDTSGWSRSQYDTRLEKSLSEAMTLLHQDRIESGKGETSMFDLKNELNIVFANQPEYGVNPQSVEVSRRGDKIEVKVKIDRDWKGLDFMDGASIRMS